MAAEENENIVKVASFYMMKKRECFFCKKNQFDVKLSEEERETLEGLGIDTKQLLNFMENVNGRESNWLIKMWCVCMTLGISKYFRRNYVRKRRRELIFSLNREHLLGPGARIEWVDNFNIKRDDTIKDGQRRKLKGFDLRINLDTKAKYAEKKGLTFDIEMIKKDKVHRRSDSVSSNEFTGCELFIKSAHQECKN